MQALVLPWRVRGHAIGFGVGVVTGEAIVGRIGYEGRIDYTAIGSVVNLASRICSAARDGQVLIDRCTAGLAAADPDDPTSKPVGDWPMKGFAEPMPVFAAKRLAGCEPRQSRMDAILIDSANRSDELVNRHEHRPRASIAGAASGARTERAQMIPFAQDRNTKAMKTFFVRGGVTDRRRDRVSETQLDISL